MRARILVLGGDGMLGWMLRTRLAADRDFQVAWTSRRGVPGAHFFEANASSEVLQRIIQTAGGYDYVVNCIAVLKNSAAEAGDPSATAEAHQINAVFPQMLAALAGKSGFKLLHVSTDAVFPPDAGRCFESDTPRPADFYGRAKLAGEPLSPHALIIRCSIIGPDPIKKKGLFEWIAGQPANATVKGYEDQLWNGVTTLQFANLCTTIFKQSLFPKLRDQLPVHHFCPNAPVTKHELVRLLCRCFRPDVQVERACGGTITRILDTRGGLGKVAGRDRPIDVAIQELSTYIGRPKAP